MCRDKCTIRHFQVCNDNWFARASQPGTWPIEPIALSRQLIGARLVITVATR